MIESINYGKLKAIEAIVMCDKQYDVDEYEEKVGLSANAFKSMKNLRLLDITGKFTSCEPTCLPGDLRWLCWRHYPFSSLPVAQMSKLVGLEVVRGAIKQFWKGQKIMPNLKFVKLQQLDRLTTFPDVSRAPNIERLILSGCTNLVEVHESLGSHKRLVKLDMIGCERLKYLPSRIEMESLKVLRLTKCSSLERFPDVSTRMGFPEIRDLITRQQLQIYHSLRQIENKDFPKNLRAFCSLENLDLSGNKFVRLPASISHLFRLRCLKLNECQRLQILHALPSRIQVLEANNCCSLENIEDLSEEYEWLYDISLINCQKLLKEEENERYIDKMLQQSLIKRCAVVNRQLRMAIPGNKIPRWFKEVQTGYKIALMIPPKCNTQIIGFAICGFFPGEWQEKHYHPCITTTFKKDGKSIHQKEVDCTNGSATAENGNTWISYRTFSSFRPFQCEDLSGGTLVISLALKSGAKAVRSAARLMYKEDVERIKKN
ncbi:hypothetical protein L1987_65319 [Smallanthus sonchifolius]|uniref:Uncharacterized protein n=1 Tax=Smallanthus sonchifolius TaxID=185202 RepID=A0ACB9BUC0_9ASTR|nr:hypothetical protein L1987_65319 [Smallanthus sonchifolius]